MIPKSSARRAESPDNYLARSTSVDPTLAPPRLVSPPKTATRQLFDKLQTGLRPQPIRDCTIGALRLLADFAIPASSNAPSTIGLKKVRNQDSAIQLAIAMRSRRIAIRHGSSSSRIGNRFTRS